MGKNWEGCRDKEQGRSSTTQQQSGDATNSFRDGRSAQEKMYIAVFVE